MCAFVVCECVSYLADDFNEGASLSRSKRTTDEDRNRDRSSTEHCVHSGLLLLVEVLVKELKP